MAGQVWEVPSLALRGTAFMFTYLCYKIKAAILYAFKSWTISHRTVDRQENYNQVCIAHLDRLSIKIVHYVTNVLIVFSDQLHILFLTKRNDRALSSQLGQLSLPSLRGR